jgi:hypothetical protein
VITYVPRISNYLVLDDIQAWRDRAEKENRTPREAWKLECVQADPSNPLPCSDEDKKKFPKGQMPEPVTTAAPVVDAGPEPTEDEELEALIKGKEGGAPKAPPTPGQESDEDLEALIKGGPKDAGAADASKPAPKTGQETDDELEQLIRGGKK